MFGYMLFNSKSGEANFRTPNEFQEKARRDIESKINNLPQSNETPKNTKLLNKFKISKYHAGVNKDSSNLTYGSSPLRKSVVVSGIESSDDCSTIDSGKSGRSLSATSIHKLMQQQRVSLSRISSNLTGNTSLFDSNHLQSIYTNSTTPTIPTTNEIDCGIISLNEALPKEFSQYYSPDLDVPRFTNGRPLYTKRPLKNWELNDTRSLLIYPELKSEWNNKIPQIQSPYPNISFRIQIIPNYLSDNQIVEYLSHSDIYKEAKFDLDFRFRTANFIVQKARFRHKELLINSFNVPESAFNDHQLINNVEYDCYFKFEWRNIIENFLLNLGIEYQCRIDFKARIKKLKESNEEKRLVLGMGVGPLSNSDHHAKNSKSNDSTLYKKTLIRQGMTFNDDIRAEIWKDVQNRVYKTLEQTC